MLSSRKLSRNKFDMHLIDCKETDEYICNAYIFGRQVPELKKIKYKKCYKKVSGDLMRAFKAGSEPSRNIEFRESSVFKSEYLFLEIFNKMNKERILFCLGEGFDRRNFFSGALSSFIKYSKNVIPNSKAVKEQDKNYTKYFGSSDVHTNLKIRGDIEKWCKNKYPEKASKFCSLHGDSLNEIAMEYANEQRALNKSSKGALKKASKDPLKKNRLVEYNAGRLIILRYPSKANNKELKQQFKKTINGFFDEKDRLLTTKDYSPYRHILRFCPYSLMYPLHIAHKGYKSLFSDNSVRKYMLVKRLFIEENYYLGFVDYPGKFYKGVLGVEMNFSAEKQFKASKICELLKNVCGLKSNLPKEIYQYINEAKFIKKCTDHRAQRLAYCTLNSFNLCKNDTSKSSLQQLKSKSDKKDSMLSKNILFDNTFFK